MKFRKNAVALRVINGVKVEVSKIPIFDNIQEFEEYYKRVDGVVPPVLYWRDPRVDVGSWVQGDDGSVQRVVKIWRYPNLNVIQTPVGIFKSLLSSRYQYRHKEATKGSPYYMDSDLSIHRYFSEHAKNEDKKRFARKIKRALLRKPSLKDQLFCAILLRGYNPVLVYRVMYGGTELEAEAFLHTTRFWEAMVKTLKETLEESPYDHRFVLDELVKMMREFKAEGLRLKAWEKLARIVGTDVQDGGPGSLPFARSPIGANPAIEDASIIDDEKLLADGENSTNTE